MIDPEFLGMLVCPATRQPLRVASSDEIAAVNDRIRGGGVRNRGGTEVAKALTAALATADGAWLYPIEDEIPILLSAEAVAARG